MDKPWGRRARKKWRRKRALARFEERLPKLKDLVKKEERTKKWFRGQIEEFNNLRKKLGMEPKNITLG